MHEFGPIGTRRKPSKRESVNFSIYLPRSTFDRLDAWRSRQTVSPPRIAVIRKIILEWLDQQESK